MDDYDTAPLGQYPSSCRGEKAVESAVCRGFGGYTNRFRDGGCPRRLRKSVCAKTLDAVAIGRHGNFLRWGFSASPKYMTEEAKTVFTNAVVYISQFAGQAPIARKFNDRIATRDYLKEKNTFVPVPLGKSV